MVKTLTKCSERILWTIVTTHIETHVWHPYYVSMEVEWNGIVLWHAGEVPKIGLFLKTCDQLN